MLFCFDMSWFICLLRDLPEQGWFSDLVTAQTKLLIQGANTPDFHVLFVLSMT